MNGNLHGIAVMPVLSVSDEVTNMGLFDVFSKGGKYFGKAIEPKCEYCEHGKRSSDGNKVLCTKKGLVNADYHCPKFLYSPLKRIPVKQMKLVGFLEGDYDERSDEEFARKAEAAQKAAAERDAAAAQTTAPAPAPAPAAKTAPAPAPAAKPAPAPAPAAKPAPAPAPAAKPAPAAAPAPAANNNLADLAAAAEASGAYNPAPAEAPKTEDTPAAPAGDGMSTLSSM